MQSGLGDKFAFGKLQECKADLGKLRILKEEVIRGEQTKMKRAQRKDLFRELKHSLNRYLSIMAIMALGVAFYVGVRSSEPDMQLTADYFLDTSDFMDIRVIGTLGLTEEDVQAVGAVDGIAQAEGAYYAEAFLETDTKTFQMMLYSIGEKVNKVELTSGRMPEQENECFLDEYFMEKYGYELGDTITFSLGTDKEITDTLHEDTYTIVGAGKYGEFLSWSRGTVSIGTGSADGFVFLPKSAFAGEVYTSVYATAEGAKKLNFYEEEYEALIEEVKDALKGIEAERCEIRYADVTVPAWEELLRAEQELADGEADMLRAEQTISDGESELALAKEQLLAKEEELSVAKQQLEAYGMPLTPELAAAESELAFAKEQLANKEAELAQAKIDYLNGKAELADAGRELADARKKLEEIEWPEWYILGRDTVRSLVEYGMDTERIGKIGQVFPAVFYLVAALVSLTTMTRMIEEERTQIGTMKALGYGKASIASKYLYYSLSATLIGSILGVMSGGYILPTVIIGAYQILYSHLPEPLTPVQWDISVLSVLIAVFCTVAATLFACYKELAAVPSVLMRPAAPKEGKRVFLERITLIWKHLSFSWKATCRNLFRYKKRFFMTIFGIGGCMALLMVGFGLRDSISDIVNNQYKKLWTYDAYLSVHDTELAPLPEESAAFVQDSMFVQLKTVDLKSDTVEKSAELFVPERLEGLEEFLKLTDRRKDGVRYELTDDGVILSEKLAATLGIEVGDSVFLKQDEAHSKEVTVMAIVENYLYHYIYMSPQQYMELYGKEPEYNQLFFKLHSMNEEQKEAFSKAAMDEEAVDTITYVEDLQERVDQMMESLNLVVVVLIIAAALLAVIVLYNLNNINIMERRRELATIRVLGFYDGELAMYVYRENILLTVLGTLFGIVVGIFLHRFVILTCEIDMIMFGRDIRTFSYFASIALTVLFSVIVNAGMFYKLRKIDMVESLKSME